MKQFSTKVCYAIALILSFTTTFTFGQGAGEVSSSQNICSGDIPSTLVETAAPTIDGPFEYQWMQTDINNTNTNTNGNGIGWVNIQGANGMNYSPPALTESTLFTRCVRKAGTTDNYVETNPILISINELPTAIDFTVNPPIPAVGFPAVFNGSSSGGTNANYEWDFDMDGFVDCIGQYCFNVFQTTGQTPLNLFVSTITNTGLVCTEEMLGIVMVSSVLPVELTSFDGYEDANLSIILKWSTATETNNSHFIIERSLDGSRFEPIGEIESAGNGNSTTGQNYSFMDESPIAGINYYKLTQVDFDGKSESFAVISVRSNSKLEGTMVYPNPAIYKLTVQTGLALSNDASIELTDAYGQVVQSSTIPSDRLNSFEVPVEHLERGVYFLSIISNRESVYTQKVFIIK